jgi:Tol biopolymer transport system component
VLYTVRMDGTEVHSLPYLIYEYPHSAKFHCPSWSPDGDRIAFVQQYAALWNTRADGSDPLRLFEGPVLCSSWSPDGKRIAFVSDSGYLPETDVHRSEIYLINPDGSDLVGLTEPPNSDENPVWSPDGSRIAFVSTRDGNPEIYLMQADGSGVVRLTADAGNDHYPTWSPDGERLAFVSDRGGNGDVYVIGADGSGLRQLTHSAADEYAPAWR